MRQGSNSPFQSSMEIPSWRYFHRHSTRIGGPNHLQVAHNMFYIIFPIQMWLQEIGSRLSGMQIPSSCSQGCLCVRASDMSVMSGSPSDNTHVRLLREYSSKYEHILKYICVFSKNIQRICLPSPSNRTRPFVTSIQDIFIPISICYDNLGCSSSLVNLALQAGQAEPLSQRLPVLPPYYNKTNWFVIDKFTREYKYFIYILDVYDQLSRS